MDKTSWLEISLQVTPEQAEAVAEVLGRFTSEGVVVERLTDDAKNPIGTPAKKVRVFGYLFADSQLEEKKMRLEEALFYLGRIQPLPDPSYKLIHDQNWMAAWKDQYQPLKVGQRLAILPAWAENPYPNRTPIRINPGMAFGTGTHPTTQLCLELMETRVGPDTDVIDVGCGSGILSIAAILLGASQAYGTDISPAAVQSSLENAKLNNISNKVSFTRGSVGEIINGTFDIVDAPLVVVNILANIIMRLFDQDLGELISPGGELILSGILETQADEVLHHAKQSGFTLIEKREIDDWVALCVSKKSAP